MNALKMLLDCSNAFSLLSILLAHLSGFSEHELELAQCPPPDASIPGLELGLALVQEMDQVSCDRQQNGLGRRLK